MSERERGGERGRRLVLSPPALSSLTLCFNAAEFIKNSCSHQHIFFFLYLLSDNWTSLHLDLDSYITMLTSRCYQAAELQIQSLYRLMTAAVLWDWLCWHGKWAMTEKVRSNKRLSYSSRVKRRLLPHLNELQTRIYACKIREMSAKQL